MSKLLKTLKESKINISAVLIIATPPSGEPVVVKKSAPRAGQGSPRFIKMDKADITCLYSTRAAKSALSYWAKQQEYDRSRAERIAEKLKLGIVKNPHLPGQTIEEQEEEMREYLAELETEGLHLYTFEARPISLS